MFTIHHLSAIGRSTAQLKARPLTKWSNSTFSTVGKTSFLQNSNSAKFSQNSFKELFAINNKSITRFEELKDFKTQNVLIKRDFNSSPITRFSSSKTSLSNFQWPQGGRWQRDMPSYYSPRDSNGNFVDDEPRGDSSSLNLLWILIAVNTAVFALWNTFGMSNRHNQMVMMKNFTASLYNLVHGRVWTLVTSAVSQINFMHFFINMFVLWSFGQTMLPYLGGRQFLMVYLLGGIFSSLGHILWNIVSGNKRDTPALGASGSTMAITTLFGLCFPRATIYVYFIPVPAIVAAGLFILYDFWGASQSNSHIAHAGHLGGAFFAIAYWFLKFRTGRF